MTVTVTSAPGTSPPNKFGGDPAVFDTAMQAHLTWQAATLVTELNAQNAENNALNSGINTACNNAVTLSTAAAVASAITAATKAGNADASATLSAASVATSAAQAQLAATYTNAPLWVSGTTYALGFVAYSPSTYRSYRRKVAGAGTTDPASDTTNWALLTLDIGSSPAEIPLNQNLGQLAFLDRLDAFVPSATPPTNNLDINFEWVSDTSIRIRMRGTDGVMRTATTAITLA